MNSEFLAFIVLGLLYIMLMDKVAILQHLGRFGDAYQRVWLWIRENMSKIIRDEDVFDEAWATHALISLNVGAFLFMLAIGYEEVFADFGFIPAYAFEAWRWITHQFIHAVEPIEFVPFSSHLLFNMLFLYVFGDNVEMWISRFKFTRLGTEINVYAGLYLIFGVVAVAVQATVVGWVSHMVMVGASGAISGVLGMYMVLFPDSKVYIADKTTLPSSVYLLFWFVSQFAVTDASIAVWAHIGGFLAGVLTAFVLKTVTS